MRQWRKVVSILTVLVGTSLANTCYDNNPPNCEYNGEVISTRCEGSSSVYPPVWRGVSANGQELVFDEDCNRVMTKPQKSIPRLAPNKSIQWCCDPLIYPLKAPARYGAASVSDLQVFSGSPKIVKNLVLLIRFQDHKDRQAPLKPRSAYEQFFNGDSINLEYNPTGSVKHYYKRQSYGKVSLESVVVGWIDVTQTESEAAAGCSSLCSINKLWHAILEGLDYADSVLDMDELDLDNDGWIDVLTVIHSGFGAETGGRDENGARYGNRIWSHSWSLNKVWQSSRGRKIQANKYTINPGNFGMSFSVGITRIGVVVHELGHFFGLPDLYDTDSSSSGVHVYDVMSNSWGMDGSQRYPQSISPWCKDKLGWIVPKTLIVGTNTIYPGNDSNDDEIYKLTNNFPASEAIWIEYRKKHEWDVKLPGGILIWHSDDDVATGNTKEWYPGLGIPYKHLLNRVIQADGMFKLEKQRWPRGYDPGVFWNENDVLSDFSGENRITPYAELIKGTACKTSGNKLFSFELLPDLDAYTVTYEVQPRVFCSRKEPPRLDLTERPTSYARTPFPSAGAPTNRPTPFPTSTPTTKAPTVRPTQEPTPWPTKYPTAETASRKPTFSPTAYTADTRPKAFPTRTPTSSPYPTIFPTADEYRTDYPTKGPSTYPTKFPASYPTGYPSQTATYPTRYPVVYPTPFPRKHSV